MKTKIAHIFNILVLTTVMVGYSDGESGSIPHTYVDFGFYIYEPEYINLSIIMGATKKSGVGYDGKGVIVFRSGDNEYKAFDATCPQHTKDFVSVELNGNGTGTANCPRCGTVYYLMNNGYSTDGHQLKQYRVSVNGDYVHVYN